MSDEVSHLNDLYEEVILDHYKNPRNFKVLPEANRKAEGYNPLCGDKVTVYLKLEDEVVQDISFEGIGCAISTAAASLMTESLKGKTLDEVKAIFEDFHDMVAGEELCEKSKQPSLGKLDVFSGVRQYPARVKCATLVWHTLNAALAQQNQTVSTE